MATTGGRGVAGATVYAVEYRYEIVQRIVVGTATTAADGSWRIDGIARPAGSEDITVCVDGSTAPAAPSTGYVSACLGDVAWDRLLVDAPFARTVLLVDDGVVSGLDVSLATGAAAGGTVTGGGRAVAGASVYAVNAAYGTFRALTAADGSYRLSGVPAGTANVCVDAATAVVSAGSPGFAAQCAAGRPWDGRAVPASATATRFVTGRTAGPIDFALGTGAALGGVVTSGGVPVAAAEVYVARATDSPLSTSGGLAYTGGTIYGPAATTDAEGRFLAAGLPPGRYAVCVDASAATATGQPTGVQSRCAGGTPFTDPHYGEGLSADSTRYVVVTGSVVDAGTTLPPAAAVAGRVLTSSGKGVAGAQVWVRAPGAYAATVVTTTTTGAWTATGLAPGTVTACVDAADASGGPAYGFTDRCYRTATWSGPYANVPTDAVPVDVTAGTTTAGIDVTLVGAGGVTGTVTSDGGVPVPGLTVVAFRSDGVPLQRHAAVTDASGSYTLRGIPPGTVRVCASAPYEAASDSPAAAVRPTCHAATAWDGLSYPAAAPDVTVKAGALTTGVDVAAPRGAAVTGAVTDATGAAVPGVYVEARTTSSSSVLASTYSGSDGRYRLPALPAGEVVVCFDARYETSGPAAATTGYLPECWDDVPWDGSSSPPAGADVVDLAVGDTVTGVDAVLAAAGGLTGKVVAARTKTAAAGLTVYAYDASGRLDATTTTAADGSFLLRGLVPGSYRTCVAPGGAGGDAADVGTLAGCARTTGWDGTAAGIPASASVTAVGAGPAQVGVITVARGGAVRGTVRSDSGAALPAAYVSVSGAAAAGPVLSAADGTFSVAGLPTGSYRVCAQVGLTPAVDTGTGYLPQCTADASTSVIAGRVTTGADVTLAAGGALLGHVTDATDGGPTGYSDVAVFTPDGTYVGSTTTTPDGSWRATGLPAGDYAVCVTWYFGGASPTGYLGRCLGGVPYSGGLPSGATTVAVTAGSTTAADIALPRGGGIRGVVTATGRNGAPLAGAAVTVFDATGGFASSATTAADGSYLAGRLPTGRYRVCVTGRTVTAPSPTGYSGRCFGGVAWSGSGAPPAGARTVAVTAGVVAGPADVTLSPAAGVSGTVSDAVDGTAVPYGSVSVFDASDANVGYASAGPDGSFQVRGLAAGSYRVCVSAFSVVTASSPAGYAARCYVDAVFNGYSVPPDATAVAVAVGAFTTVDVALPRSVGFTGTVTDTATGVPLAGVGIRVFRPGVPGAVNSYGDATSATGTYVVRGLAAGSYVVCFDGTRASSASSSSGYFSECHDDQAWGAVGNPPASATAVTLTAGVVTVDAALAASGAIGGHVTGPAGAPAAYASVAVLAAGQTFPMTVVQAGSDGAWFAGGLKPGSYRACVYGQTYDPTGTGSLGQCYRAVVWNSSFPAPDAASAVAVRLGATTAGIDLAQSPAGALAGVVTDASGTALAGVPVTVYRGTDALTTAYQSGADGWRLAGMAPGSYMVCFYGGNATGGSSTTGYRSECFDDVAWPDGTAPPTAAATPVTVTVGVVTTLTAALAPR